MPIALSLENRREAVLFTCAVFNIAKSLNELRLNDLINRVQMT